MSVCAADYDRDGWLDFYVTSYQLQYDDKGLATHPIPYHDAQNGPPNFFYRNQGDGTFRDVTEFTGLGRNNNRFSYACGWGDYDNDGDPDLYVANDFGRNNLYRNNGDGTLTDVAAEAGVEDIGAGMSVAWEDYDNDGWLDLYVGNMWSSAGLRVTSQESFKQEATDNLQSMFRRHAKGNTLFRNRGDGTFEDVTQLAGVALGRWAWGSDFLDLDRDGFEDIFVVNGFMTNESSHHLTGKPGMPTTRRGGWRCPTSWPRAGLSAGTSRTVSISTSAMAPSRMSPRWRGWNRTGTDVLLRLWMWTAMATSI
jgi:hypothetical protein